jgi:periplasmic protein TonB
MKFTLKVVLWLLSLTTALLLSHPNATAQVRTEPIYTVVEQEPEFPGGKAALSQYLASNIQFPSALMRKNYNTGPVAAKFIIDKAGAVRDVRVTTKPISKDMQKGMQEFMKAIIAAIEKMPPWRPGQVNGQSVSVFYTLPIEVNMQ